MKYGVTKDKEGTVALQLGLSHYATFAPQASEEDVVMGVLGLIGKVSGIDAFAMAQDVMTALTEETKTDG